MSKETKQAAVVITYEIREEGNLVAKIEAESGEQALEIAAARYPRRACDYNGYVGPIGWAAFEPDYNHAVASIELMVSP